MAHSQIARAAGMIFIITMIGLSCPSAQLPTTGAPTLQQFFQGLVQQHDPARLPKHEELLRATDQIPGSPAADISNALPAIFAALTHRDETVEKYAASALWDIAQRPDGAVLLKPHVDAVGGLFNSPNDRLQAAGAAILGSLRPAPPPEVVPLLVSFLQRTDRAVPAQAAALFYLVRLAPDTPAVVAVIREFLQRPMAREDRIAALNALGDPRIKDVQIIEAVIAGLQDPDPGIRFTAVQVIQRMSKEALLRAEPALRKLAESTEPPAGDENDRRMAGQIKSYAVQALQEIDRLNKP